jgi:hypothetical protein
MDPSTIQLYDDLSGQALNEFIGMKIKHFCFEQAGNQANTQFD